MPVAETVWMRTREVWLHAVDLDNGGTFTDFILLDGTRDDIRLHKCLTTAQAAHGLRVESARIDALPAPGRVRAELTLARP